MLKIKDYHLLIILLAISFVSVYFMPALVNRMVFLGMLYAAYKTKLDYVYLVWFFIINDAPGRLFSAGEFGAVRIPLYPLVPGISIGFQELFIILYILKFLHMSRPFHFVFKKELTWFLLFGLLVAGYSFFLGMSFDNMVRTFRNLLPWTMLFIIPAFIYNKQLLLRTSLLLFPVVFAALGAQVFAYIYGTYPDHYLRGAESRYLGLDDGSAARAYSAVYIILFSIIQAFYFLYAHKSSVSRNYAAAVIFIGIFSIFITATRGWIIALSFFLLGILAVYGISRLIVRWSRLVVVSAVVAGIIVALFPGIQNQASSAYQRLTTLEALASGDVTAGGTLQRLDVRAPKVLSKFWESPLIGWGFSNEFYAYSDGHVGHHNILLNIGIFGYILINALFALICLKIYRLAAQEKRRWHIHSPLLIYLLGLLTIFIIHSSSTQFWGYTMSMDKKLFFGFFFAAINTMYAQTSADSIPNPANRSLTEPILQKC